MGMYEKIRHKLIAQQESSNEEQRRALRSELESIYKRQSDHLKDEIQGLYAKVAGSMATQTQIEEERLAVESVASFTPRSTSRGDGLSVADSSSPQAEGNRKNRWCIGGPWRHGHAIEPPATNAAWERPKLQAELSV